MTQQRWHVLAPLTGVVFVALVVIAFIISGETPDTNDSPQKILSFYNDNDSEQMFSSALLAWAALVIGVAAVTPIGFFAFMAFGLWTLATSVILWRAPATATPAAPATVG